MALAFTRRALVALREVLDQTDAAGSQAFRLTASADGKLDFVLDTPQDDDVIVRLDDTTVMIVEPRLNRELDGLTLDLQETSDEPVWTLKKEKSVQHRQDGKSIRS